MSHELRRRFRRNLLRWSSSHRRSFIWRRRGFSRFQLLVAEMLLRKTQAETVQPVLTRLLKRFPTPNSLSPAPLRSIEAMLRPLGLFRIRARGIKAVARAIHSAGNRVPASEEGLTALPHVGRYAANAVLCFGYGRPVAIVDANVARVLGRVFGLRKPVELHKAEVYWQLAGKLVPRVQPREFNWGLLDLGALVCTPRRPSCEVCPLVDICKYAKYSSRKADRA